MNNCVMYLESGMPLNELTAQGARKKMNNCVMYLEKRSELSMIHREGIIIKITIFNQN